MTTTSAGGAAGWSTDAASDLLGPWIAAGVLGDVEVQLVTAVVRAAPARPSDDVLIGLALAVRATRLGHVCVDLPTARDQIVAALDDEGRAAAPTLPDPDRWRDALASSSIVTVVPGPGPEAGDDLVRPLVLEGNRLYLQRFWRFEVSVADEVGRRAAAALRPPDDSPQDDGADVDRWLAEVFGGVPLDEDGTVDLQYVAARRALTRPVSVITGGPGTGKTHTVARILAAAVQAAAHRGDVLRVALAAPTGKAATRMKEAVDGQLAELESAGRIDTRAADSLRSVEPTTIHHLLGRDTRTTFRHDRRDPLAHDLVIIDETSMVSLPLLARLLDAVRPGARLVLVGDPFQLASIEAGTVLGDMVGTPGDRGAPSAPLDGCVTELRRGHRFDESSATAALALAVRDGDADAVIGRLASGVGAVRWVRPDDGPALAALRQLVRSAAAAVVEAGLAGDAGAALDAATRVKVLAAVRRGPFGLFEWTDAIGDAVRGLVPPSLAGGRPRVGSPVMVTHNDPVNRLANGDVGVVVLADGGRWVAMPGPDGPRLLAPARLGEWEPWWAMTIHKSQGSEFRHAVVSLPTVDSPILTRELLYTAVTRAKPEVTLVASEEILRLAVGRPVARASGLRDRLWPAI